LRAYEQNEYVHKHVKEVKKKMYRGRRGIFPGNGPFRDLPPWQRPGWVYGYGRGYGVGYGRGYAYLGDPSKCARFPWLPRWWWANPDYQGTPPFPAPTGEDEKKFLEDQVKYMEEELSEIRKRINELASQQET
jgi:hypothetical protein